MRDLLKKLIRAETTAEKGELAAAVIISDELSRLGINSTIDSWDDHRANITALIKSSGQKPGLLFACHLDVVPHGEQVWENPPFAAVGDDGKIYGRGSADMKAGITAIVTAIEQIVSSDVKLEGDLVFCAVAGEETDSCGAKKFVKDWSEKLPPLTGIILPEPTDFEVITAHRGMLWLEISTKGKTAHGSTPQLGINAITAMKVLLNELDNFQIDCKPHELLGDCSMSINKIIGGEAINVVPDKCSIKIDIRTLPKQNHQQIIDNFEKTFAKLKQKDPEFDAEVKIVRTVDAMETDVTCDFVKDFCSAVGVSKTKAVGFATDGPHFAPFKTPVVVFGPGKSEVCHKPDEYIDIADIEKAVEYYKNIILEFLT